MRVARAMSTKEDFLREKRLSRNKRSSSPPTGTPFPEQEEDEQLKQQQEQEQVDSRSTKQFTTTPGSPSSSGGTRTLMIDNINIESKVSKSGSWSPAAAPGARPESWSAGPEERLQRRQSKQFLQPASSKGFSRETPSMPIQKYTITPTASAIAASPFAAQPINAIQNTSAAV